MNERRGFLGGRRPRVGLYDDQPPPQTALPRIIKHLPCVEKTYFDRRDSKLEELGSAEQRLQTATG